MKDWILQESQINKQNFNRTVHSYNALKICADLANKSKHLVLDIIRVDADIESCSVQINVPTMRIILNNQESKHQESEPVAVGLNSWEYNISTCNGKVYKASEIAVQAVKDWEEILKNHNLF